MNKEKFDVTGMTCSACALNVEKVVKKLPGVSSVQVNLMNNSMQVTYDGEDSLGELVSSAVHDAGYEAVSQVTKKTGKEKASADSLSQELLMKKRFLYSLILMLPLMYIAMGDMLHLPMPGIFSGTSNIMINALAQFLMAIVVLIINRNYFIVGFKLLVKKAPNMDSLIAVGSSAALIYGIFALFKMAFGLGHGDMELVKAASHELYFESAAMIVTLITLGKFLEAKSKGRTSKALEKLLALAPKTASVIRDGVEVEISVEEVVIGDQVVIRPGQNIPVDGVILKGNSSVDQSAITGESIPVEKHPGDEIIAATINKNGFFTMEAKKVGDDTTFAQIIQLVEEASASKAPISKLTDKISGIFVPTVIAISIVTFVVWLLVGKSFPFSLSMAIAVLVISCPCALGLATPVAIMVATGKGAQNGILFKSAEALELTHQVNSVVLDKTGTITMGSPQITDIVAFSKDYDENDFLSLAASIEHPSEHPLAEAVIKKAEDLGLALMQVESFAATPGKGIEARIDKESFIAGNKSLMDEKRIDLKEDVLNKIEEFSIQGKTPLLFASEKEFLGIIAVSDVVKPTSKGAIEKLHNMGMEIIMLTGDNQRSAEAIGAMVGVDKVMANVLPADKEAIVRQLQDQGKKVAMVGDGINDAPALTRADIGIAIGAGTDVAIESADVVLMKSDLMDVIVANELSKATLNNIKGNLFWAFFYNVLGIPLAAGVFYSWLGWQLNPMFAAAAMSLSSIFVVTNALRLRSFKAHGKNNKPVEVVTDISDEDIGDGQLEYLSTQKDVIFDEQITLENKQLGSDNMTKTIYIDGMSCGHCQASVTKALSALNQVQSVDVSLEDKRASLKLKEDISDKQLTKIIDDLGYKVTSIE